MVLDGSWVNAGVGGEGRLQGEREQGCTSGIRTPSSDSRVMITDTKGDNDGIGDMVWH